MTRRIQHIKPKTSTLKVGRAPIALLNPNATKRMTGRGLQDRRFKMWAKAVGQCANCGCLTDYPHGFELDHILRLEEGAPDTEANCQILCCWYDKEGNKRGCHAEKTAAEARRKK